MNSMRLSILVAWARNRVIGNKNALPWHLPADLKHFKSLTLGHQIIMGRKTYESIGRPLPGRTNIIITHQVNYQAPGSIVVHSLADAIQICRNEHKQDGEGFIIGGAELYKQAMDFCQRMYITELQEDFVGDTCFPIFNREEWCETAREKHFSDDKNPVEYHFVILDRKPKSP